MVTCHITLKERVPEVKAGSVITNVESFTGRQSLPIAPQLVLLGHMEGNC